MLTTKDVAARFEIKPVQLRRILRSMPEYADGGYTEYRWYGWQDEAIAKIAAAVSKVKKPSESASNPGEVGHSSPVTKTGGRLTESQVIEGVCQFLRKNGFRALRRPQRLLDRRRLPLWRDGDEAPAQPVAPEAAALVVSLFQPCGLVQALQRIRRELLETTPVASLLRPCVLPLPLSRPRP